MFSLGWPRYVRHAGHLCRRVDLHGRAAADRAALLQQVPADVRGLLQERLSAVPLRQRLRPADLFDGMREFRAARRDGVSLSEGVGTDLRLHLVQGPVACSGADTQSHVVEEAA